tara:strand:- start:25935 stop:27056 length:1122 start_codon:yes stop_codon:yes gene_type:complete
MKKFKCVAAGICCLWTISVNAQDYPVLTENDDDYILTIPYLEYGGVDDTKASSAELIASKANDSLIFSVNESSLIALDVDSPSPISGDGACSRTTNAQFLSCRAGVQNDFFEGQANCFNISDADEQAECMAEVEEERLDAVEECGAIEEVHEALCEVFGEDPYDPDLDGITFVDMDAIAANPNPFFPLIPGNIWVYEAEDETITVVVLDEIRQIMGIDAVVVRDTVEEDGELVEDTMDWYAQDDDGNVWYMGEISLNYEDGELVDIDGSWETGKDGAKPGILFRAMPEVGEVYRQEYRIGEAEDIGETLALDADESTESGFECASGCLQNLEYTPLDPEVEEHKYYLPGTGMILEVDLENGERVELVDFTSAL